MKVFKFGGASVNSAAAVRNMATIVSQRLDGALTVVVSAMGKTTNMLEQLVPGVHPASEHEPLLAQVRDYHYTIVRDLFPQPSHPVYNALAVLFAQLEEQTSRPPTAYNFDYSQTVCFGELISTTIISHYLNTLGIQNQWVDVRTVIRTDNQYREGIVDFAATQRNVDRLVAPILEHNIVITQGFIAGSADGHTSTLGREGSDYSAAILSYCLGAESMTIWKDVPGFLNADPKYFPDTVKIEQIPYNEAIELAYYGASVIHPKTVKPIQNKNIQLHIKSFLNPDAPGSIVGPFPTIRPLTPLYIFKRVNLMQNTALSFSLCIDDNPLLLAQLRDQLQGQFLLRYNQGLQLITIRYYTQDIIDRIVGSRTILLQQRTRTTTQLIIQ